MAREQRRRGAERAKEWGGRLLRGCRLGDAGLHPSLRSPPTLCLEDHFPIFGAILPHRLGMRQGPAVRQKVKQVRRAEFEVRRMVLLGVGQFAQRILQVVVDHQMMAMRTADDTVQLQAACCCLGMP